MKKCGRSDVADVQEQFATAFATARVAFCLGSAIQNRNRIGIVFTFADRAVLFALPRRAVRRVGGGPTCGVAGGQHGETQMLHLVRFLAVLGVMAGLGPAVVVAQEKPVRALFVLVGAGGHDVEKNTPPLLKALEKVDGLKVALLAPPKGKPGDGSHLAKLADIKRADYDVLVFYTVGNSLKPEQEKALQSFVEEGGGIVAIHGVTASFGNSKVWLNLVGARFAGHAPGLYDLTVEITDPTHPITAGVDAFTINDEEYTYKFAEGVKRHVLARFKERPAKSKEKKNNDILWTIEVGKGRIFHSGLGHDVKAWSTPEFQKLIAQGIFWAAGQPRRVTLSK